MVAFSFGNKTDTVFRPLEAVPSGLPYNLRQTEIGAEEEPTHEP